MPQNVPSAYWNSCGPEAGCVKFSGERTEPNKPPISRELGMHLTQVAPISCAYHQARASQIFETLPEAGAEVVSGAKFEQLATVSGTARLAVRRMKPCALRARGAETARSSRDHNVWWLPESNAYPVHEISPTHFAGPGNALSPRTSRITGFASIEQGPGRHFGSAVAQRTYARFSSKTSGDVLRRERLLGALRRGQRFPGRSKNLQRLRRCAGAPPGDPHAGCQFRLLPDRPPE